MATHNAFIAKQILRLAAMGPVVKAWKKEGDMAGAPMMAGTKPRIPSNQPKMLKPTIKTSLTRRSVI